MKKFHNHYRYISQSYLFLLVIVLIDRKCIASTTPAPKNYGNFPIVIDQPKQYEYNLPNRKVNSCPSFASFKFSCGLNHIISLEALSFSPVLIDSNGECTSDWTSECYDKEHAFDYASKECSGRESCTLISYQLRSRTKCSYHQVISINYKCVPTWEIIDVPVKCDICKNVTINNLNDNYGFIHSASYPKLYNRVTCHSIIKNRPDHFIIIYSVSGSIGLDRIQVESHNEYGNLAIREILTGNLTTKLIMTSPYDVNVTVLTEDTYYFDQRRFLLYFYIVPKCSIILCSNMTGFPPPPSSHNHNHNYLTTIGNNQGYASVYPINRSTATSNYQQSTYAPPLKAAENNSNNRNSGGSTNNFYYSKLSDAWLAAILALCYALLMVFAVLTAIYCRRKRKRSIIDNKLILAPGSISTSHIIQQHPLSRAHSHVSLRDLSASHPNHISHISNPNNEFYNVYSSHIENNNNSSTEHFNTLSAQQLQHHYNYLTDNSFIDQRIMRSGKMIQQQEFDNYSQVINTDIGEDDDEDDNCSLSGRSIVINYGDIDVQKSSNVLDNCSDDNIHHTATTSTSYPYTVKTNTHLGSIIASANSYAINGNNEPSALYRAVEYTKSPRLERVRVRTCEDIHDDTVTAGTFESTLKSNEYSFCRSNNKNDIEIVDSSGLMTSSIICRQENMLESNHHRHVNKEYEYNSREEEEEESEKKFVVKLFPFDEQEKEIQEMSMYVTNETVVNNHQTNSYRNYSPNIFY